MNILSIITARAGSKRIPNKNIKLLNGNPLISYIINAAKESEYLHRVIVSTDSEKIAEVSKEYRAEVPFLRPKVLATDTASSVDVVLHCIEWLKEKEKYYPDVIVLLQPTSPLCSSKDIDKTIKLYLDNKNKYDAVSSVKKVEEYPEWMYSINANGYVEKAFPKLCKNKSMRSQDIPERYIPNGAIKLIETKVFVKNKSFNTDKTGIYIMPKERSIDIDEKFDFVLCEFLLDE
jgi:CMP-N-acetylneuraminic acid synthetase